MGALKIAVSALFLALLGPGVQAGAWKCQIDGKIVFSDVPCPAQGRQIDTTSGQTRGFSGPRQEMLREQAREQAEAQERRLTALESSRVRAAPAPRSCPTALQIKNWETALSSNYQTPGGSAESARAGLERAKRCAEGRDPDVREPAPPKPRPRVCHSIGGGQVLCP